MNYRLSCRLHVLKKKCDEGRPQCSRCAERGHSCIYEAVKPRQRRKRIDGPSTTSASSSAAPTSASTVSTSASSSVGKITRVPTQSASPEQWSEDQYEEESAGCGAESITSDMVSPVEGSFETGNMFAFDTGLDVPLTSPLAAGTFDFSNTEMGVDRSDENGEDEPPQTTSVPETSMAMVSSTSSSDSPYIASNPIMDLHFPCFFEFVDRPNRRALVDHFCNVMSHLIVFREERGNPFQQLILPLSHRSKPVMNALCALASAHLEYRGIQNPESSMHFHNMAIQGLAKLIEHDNKSNRNELLAAIILMVYYEVLVQKGRSNIIDGHLKGAMTIIDSAPTASDPTGMFLERAFRFYDVIAALSFGTAPLSSAPAAGYLAPFPPVEDSDLSALSNVDTLLGLATTLWPMMHRLSTLFSLKAELENAVASKQSSKAAVIRTELETTASTIEVALKQWQPVLPHAVDLPAKEEDMTEEQARLLSALNNALAYRHSALVYLYRTVHGYPRGHHLVQTHAHVSLTHCVATVSHAGPMGALLWPLFAAACEAISDSDRTMARTSFAAVERRQGMTNIGRAWEIVQEVWRRADALATTPGSPGPTFSATKDRSASHLWRRGVSNRAGALFSTWTSIFGFCFPRWYYAFWDMIKDTGKNGQAKLLSKFEVHDQEIYPQVKVIIQGSVGRAGAPCSMISFPSTFHRTSSATRMCISVPTATGTMMGLGDVAKGYGFCYQVFVFSNREEDRDHPAMLR
ncbi:uncharacterized protein MKZ38_009190 [Zalerion maritima]|uniref:Zn(2)-C6 fungal-type domain-containing protein n=1 Tax=Zalerion maritima TaxID=339359 RepID=A0AAD5RTQ5_9PEZI|nr:uncharacterized protein MKZ38_009190 [Zalerion maritima]